MISIAERPVDTGRAGHELNATSRNNLMRFRHDFFFATGLLITIASRALTSPLLADEPAGPARPNIIFVLTDDQRWDALGCMGNPAIHTPNIDALAERGTLFTNMFCTTSICATSRATFLTGQWERRHGIDDFRTPLSSEQFANSFPGLLRKNGYRTGMVGKWGLGGPLPNNDYDDFNGFSGQGRYFPKGQLNEPGTHLTHRIGDQAVEFLDSCRADEPFLLQLYTKASHCQDGDPWPFQPDPRYRALFADTTIPLPSTATEEHFAALPEFLQTSEARKRWTIRFADAKMFQKSVKDYYRLIAGIDDIVGRLVKKLEQKKLADNTVIIFTSDNGFYLGERGLAGKWFMHEESIRLPLVICDFRLAEKSHPSRVAKIVLNADIAPTILDLAGVPIPSTVQGQSMVPHLNGKRVTWRDDFLYEHRFTHSRIPKTEGVRTKSWTYTRYTSIDPVYEELFDLEADPHEESNLAGDPAHAAQLERLRDRWQELAKKRE